MIDVLSGILLGTVWGAAVFGGIAYFAVQFAGRIMGRELPSTGVAAIVVLICIFVFPSLPRFKFEKDTRAELVAIPGVRIVSEVKVGDLVEPVTWFRAPVGVFTVASPDPLQIGTFQVATFRYGEVEPFVSIRDVHCATREYTVSIPDVNGVFRTLPERTVLTDQDYLGFCESDWESELSEIRAAIRGAGDK